jgi:hypothetical protein
VNGSRDRAFNFTLDGIDINESTAGGSNFTPLRPNPDSVQEFQVVTSNFTAELGRSSGAQVTLVTKSGSNDFHGNAFEFYRTPRLDAKSYPVTIAGVPKDQFVQHIFGGSAVVHSTIPVSAKAQSTVGCETKHSSLSTCNCCAHTTPRS